MKDLQIKYINIDGKKVKLSIFKDSKSSMEELEEEARTAYKFGVPNATFSNFQGDKNREFIEVL